MYIYIKYACSKATKDGNGSYEIARACAQFFVLNLCACLDYVQNIYKFPASELGKNQTTLQNSNAHIQALPLTFTIFQINQSKSTGRVAHTKSTSHTLQVIQIPLRKAKSKHLTSDKNDSITIRKSHARV